MHYLIKLFIQRLALGLLTLFVVSLVIFLSIELLPGDVAQQVARAIRDARKPCGFPA